LHWASPAMITLAGPLCSHATAPLSSRRFVSQNAVDRARITRWWLGLRSSERCRLEPPLNAECLASSKTSSSFGISVGRAGYTARRAANVVCSTETDEVGRPSFGQVFGWQRCRDRGTGVSLRLDCRQRILAIDGSMACPRSSVHKQDPEKTIDPFRKPRGIAAANPPRLAGEDIR
jgi:hypothetical protein